jgi:hypothetical protein
VESADRAGRGSRLYVSFFLRWCRLDRHVGRGTGLDGGDVSALVGLLTIAAALWVVVPLLRIRTVFQFLNRDVSG